MKIMYVEDNPANLSLLLRIARMGGHVVISYTEGEAALTNYDLDKPDLVLMDVQLSGGLTGLDVVRNLRGRGHKTPIVAVTAYAMTGDKERCIEAGCDTYIAKPLPIQELVELIQRYENLMKGTPIIKPLTGTLTPPPAPVPAAPAPAAISPVPAATTPVPTATTPAPTAITTTEAPSAPAVVVPPFVSAEGTAPNTKAEGEPQKPEIKPEDRTEANRKNITDSIKTVGQSST